MDWNIPGVIGRYVGSGSGPAEDPTQESAERYRQLIEASPAPINLFDATGEVVWGNDAVVELLGLESRAALVGRSIFEFIDPDDRETAERELRAVVEEKRATGPTTMQLRRVDGDRRRIRVSTAPGRFRGRDIGQAVVVDVTPVYDARRDLEREREFVERALDAVQDVFYVIDTEGTMVRWNEALLERFGYGEAEVQDMGIEAFFVDEDVERVSRSIEAAFENGEDVLEATVVTKHGAEVPYEFRKRRLVVDDEAVGVVGIGRDVSERRARDSHLRAIDRLLQHSLRNQLNVVQGSTTLLGERVDDDGRADVERIREAVDRLLSIFSNHRKIVQLFTEDAAPRAFDVVPAVEAAVEECRATHPRAAVDCRTVGHASISAIPALRDAIEELLDNAARHSDRAEPAIEVSVDRVAAGVRIRVADDGPTIPEMEQAVVTESVPTSATYHSEGLGLWFVHWVVERSGGTLSFGDHEPRGNVVTIVVPPADSG